MQKSSGEFPTNRFFLIKKQLLELERRGQRWFSLIYVLYPGPQPIFTAGPTQQ